MPTTLLPIIWLVALPRSQAGPMVHADIEVGFPSVVALGIEIDDTAYTFCSGNLITPRIVLTAAHCLDDQRSEQILTTWRSFFGIFASNPDDVLGFEGSIVHPDYLDLLLLGGPMNDVALLFLDEDAPVEPTPFHRDEVTDEDIGEALTSVGFGIFDSETEEGSGTKRSADFTLDRLEDAFIFIYANEYGAMVCRGDSGGPQFHAEGDLLVQWSIHSYSDSSCSSYCGSTRTDLMAEWVLEEIEAYHGTRDLCAINGWYNDGICHPDCDEVDVDCFWDTEGGGDTGGGGDTEGGGDTGGGRHAGGCACSSGGSRGGLLGLLPLALLGIRRRQPQVS